MAERRATLRPTKAARVLTIRLRIAAKGVPPGARVDIADVMLQAGATVTGWSPHVTELPWTSGIVGGP